MNVVPGSVPRLRELLEAHPHTQIQETGTDAALEFWESGRHHRKIWIDNPAAELYGIIELIDNNPLVCADEFSLPSPEGTLALVAWGPLLRNGLLVEPPTALLAFEADEEAIEHALEHAGWTGGFGGSASPQPLGSVLAGTFLGVIPSPSHIRDLDEVYEEIYGNSFFVRNNEAADWDTKEVVGQPFASYRLRITPDEPNALLTVQVMADVNGKCGAAQIVHAMNVMCGFEESLGLL